MIPDFIRRLKIDQGPSLFLRLRLQRDGQILLQKRDQFVQITGVPEPGVLVQPQHRGNLAVEKIAQHGPGRAQQFDPLGYGNVRQNQKQFSPVRIVKPARPVIMEVGSHLDPQIVPQRRQPGRATVDAENEVDPGFGTRGLIGAEPFPSC